MARPRVLIVYPPGLRIDPWVAAAEFFDRRGADVIVAVLPASGPEAREELVTNLLPQLFGVPAPSYTMAYSYYHDTIITCGDVGEARVAAGVEDSPTHAIVDCPSLSQAVLAGDIVPPNMTAQVWSAVSTEEPHVPLTVGEAGAPGVAPGPGVLLTHALVVEEYLSLKAYGAIPQGPAELKTTILTPTSHGGGVMHLPVLMGHEGRVRTPTPLPGVGGNIMTPVGTKDFTNAVTEMAALPPSLFASFLGHLGVTKAQFVTGCVIVAVLLLAVLYNSGPEPVDATTILAPVAVDPMAATNQTVTEFWTTVMPHVGLF